MLHSIKQSSFIKNIDVQVMSLMSKEEYEARKRGHNQTAQIRALRASTGLSLAQMMPMIYLQAATAAAAQAAIAEVASTPEPVKKIPPRMMHEMPRSQSSGETYPFDAYGTYRNNKELNFPLHNSDGTRAYVNGQDVHPQASQARLGAFGAPHNGCSWIL